jgi:L-fucose isomerase-like protein
MSEIDRPTTFGVIVGTRGFFNPSLAIEGRKSLVSRLTALGYGVVALPEESTPARGAVESRADALKCAELFRSKRDAIDGIIVSLPNFGDETGIIEALQGGGLPVPVLVHAADDDVDKVDVTHRRDAFCGKLSVCSNLRQYGIQWTDTTEHTCRVESPELAADIERFARICRIVRGVRGARIGAIGARPAAFQTVRFSEKIFQTSGITVVPVDLSVVLAAAEGITDSSEEVREKLTAIRAYGSIPSRIPQASVVKQAKLSVVIERWMDENGCVASAIQCWDSVQKNYGCATCLTMSMMGEQRRMPGACEVDVSGAVSMYVLTLATGGASALLDWNNNYGADREKCVNTHCSNFPRSFMGGDIEISELDILGATLGRERCFGAIKGKVAKGSMTAFRIETDDVTGRMRGYVAEGQFTDDPFPMDGGVAVCAVRDLRGLLRHISSNGFAHHVAMVRSHCAESVLEATTRYLGWDVYAHGAEGVQR